MGIFLLSGTSTCITQIRCTYQRKRPLSQRPKWYERLCGKIKGCFIIVTYWSNKVDFYEFLSLIRLFSGVKKHFIFQQHDGKVSVRNNVVVTHLTSVSQKSENAFYFSVIKGAFFHDCHQFFSLHCRIACTPYWSTLLCTARRSLGCRGS